MFFALGLCVLWSLTASPTFARNVLGGESDAAAEEKADNEKASQAENAQSAA